MDKFLNKAGVRLNVLCVEDNRINQKILTKALDALGIDSKVANNGIEALELLKQSKAFDLIIMDCMMPEMDGFEATRLIRHDVNYQDFSNTPIIAMTGNDNAEHKQECLNCGMNDVLFKPVEQDILAEKIYFWINNADTSHLPDEPSDNKRQAECEHDKSTWDKEAFFKRVQHNDIIAEQIISLFLQEMPAVCESLLRAIAEGNMENVVQLAHKLKGTVRNLSGHKLAQVLSDIEAQARKNENDKVNELSLLLSNEFMNFIRLLNAYI